MADKKQGDKNAAPQDSKKPVSQSELRDLDMLDSKIEKVKGGRRRNIGRKRN